MKNNINKKKKPKKSVNIFCLIWVQIVCHGYKTMLRPPPPAHIACNIVKWDEVVFVHK